MKLFAVVACGVMIWYYPSLIFNLFKIVAIAAIGHVGFSILYLWQEQTPTSKSDTAAAAAVTETPLFKVFGCDVVLRSCADEDDQEGVERKVLWMMVEMGNWVGRRVLGLFDERRGRARDENENKNGNGNGNGNEQTETLLTSDKGNGIRTIDVGNEE
jgi:hypothetical protein